MNEREKILRYYRASGDEDIAARLLNLADVVLRNRKYKVSEFLDPFEYSVAETIAKQYALSLKADGGYTSAERVKVAFMDQDFPGTIEFEITALSVSWDSRYYSLSHRDVLGALMSLSIKREVFGDIIMSKESCQIIADKAMLSFIIEHLVQIGSAPVSIEEIECTTILPREEKVKEVRTTVPSLRLDVVAASGFGTSRTKMTEDIKNEKVKVNWQDTKNPSLAIKQGDILSMRGRGRVEISEILGQTKKGRLSVVLKRFI